MPSSGPRWNRCCAAATRRLHDISIEVLAAYQLARIARTVDGFSFADLAPAA
jgi:hypothetical protein